MWTSPCSRPYAVALEAVAQALARKFWQRRRRGHVGLDDVAAAAAAADAARLCAELTTDEALHLVGLCRVTQ